MILPIFSMRDKVAESFQSCSLDTNDFVAKRNFSYAVNNSPELLFKSKDLELYRVGVFDTEKGCITPVIPAVLVCRGDEVIQDGK